LELSASCLLFADAGVTALKIKRAMQSKTQSSCEGAENQNAPSLFGRQAEQEAR
jgi:hypothetical protein